MATQQSATVNITNRTDGNARILLFHSNSTNGMQSGSWNARPGETVGSLTVFFESGIGTRLIDDEWAVLIQVKDGTTPGFYISTGGELDPPWQENQLGHTDAGKTLTLSVDSKTFTVALNSGTKQGGMTRLAPPAPVTHVFVVMLENHSFDQMFAMSGIPGITAATTNDSNSYNNITYNVQSSAPVIMPTDPGHEFLDVVEQLAGPGVKYQPGQPYPPVNNSGFASNYATSTTEGPVPLAEDVGKIMACYATPAQLPVIYQMAKDFVLCDQWFSSVPGPTWPNRFFVHGASSAGFDGSPTNQQIGEWCLPGHGFNYPNGSIFKSLVKAGIPYRIYHDSADFPTFLSLYAGDPQIGSPGGALTQVGALTGISILKIRSLKSLAADLQGPYPHLYTFIEPHYGDPAGEWQGGSGQHPKSDIYGGENLLGALYSAIRNSPYWETSLLVVVYDEHGGFYDSVKPGPAPAPGDNPPPGLNQFGFDFTQYGPRVPAIIISPWVPAGAVDHTLYDHTSVLATLERMWGLPPLTQRDAKANDFLSLLSNKTPRTDCATSLPPPAPVGRAATQGKTVEQRAVLDSEPLPETGSLIGTLMNMKKADLEVAAGSPAEIAAINLRFDAIKTRGDARTYIESVMEKVGLAQEQRKIAKAAPKAGPAIQS